MSKLSFDVGASLWREVKQARSEGIDIVIVPADKYARICRSEYLQGQLDLITKLLDASSGDKRRDLQEAHDVLFNAVRTLQVASSRYDELAAS